jgi:hypothetical protein
MKFSTKQNFCDFRGPRKQRIRRGQNNRGTLESTGSVAPERGDEIAGDSECFLCANGRHPNSGTELGCQTFDATQERFGAKSPTKLPSGIHERDHTIGDVFVAVTAPSKFHLMCCEWMSASRAIKELDDNSHQ